MATIFDKKNSGANKKLRALRGKSVEVLDTLTRCAEQYDYPTGVDSEVHGLRNCILEATEYVDAVLSEAKIMHNISRDARSAKALRIAHIDTEI